LKGRQAKLSVKQQRELKRMHEKGEYSITDLGELSSTAGRVEAPTRTEHRPPQASTDTDLCSRPDRPILEPWQQRQHPQIAASHACGSCQPLPRLA